MRPPKPRYTHTWDVHLVTKYFSSLGKTKLLPLKLLPIKLAMLFALSCPETCFVPHKTGPLTLPCSPRRRFLHSRVSAKARLSRSTTSSLFLRLFHTTRDSVPLALYAITLKLHETYVQFFHHQSQTLFCLLHQTA